MITKKFHEELITDYEKFNLFLTEYTDVIMQKVLLSIPEIVLYHLKETQKIKKLRELFYKDNPEFINHTDLILKVANQIQEKYPELSIEDVFNKTKAKIKKVISEVKK